MIKYNIHCKLYAYLIKYNLYDKFISNLKKHHQLFGNNNEPINHIIKAFNIHNTPEGYDFWFNHQEQFIKFKKHYTCKTETVSILNKIIAKLSR